MHTVTNNAVIRVFTPPLEGASSTLNAGGRRLHVWTWRSDFSDELGLLGGRPQFAWPVLGATRQYADVDSVLGRRSEQVVYWASRLCADLLFGFVKFFDGQFEEKVVCLSSMYFVLILRGLLHI